MRERRGSTKNIRRKPSSVARTAHYDNFLFFSIVILLVFGVVMVFSASAPYSIRTQGNPYYFFKNDLIYATAGLIAMVLTSFVDYRLYQKLAAPILIVTFGLCLLVFVPGIGVTINGAKRWIGLGQSFTFMPSDLLKVGSIVFLCAVLSRRPPEENVGFGLFLRVIFFILIMILPIFLQPNFSAVIVIATSLLFIYFVGGMERKYLILLMIIGALALAWAFRPYEGNYRLDRLLVIFDPMKDPRGDGWQLLQSLYGVSSGGFFGVGFGQGAQKYDYLADEPHNDFIFSVISEELGFVGALLVIILYCFLIYRALLASHHCRTHFGRLLGYALTFLIAFQAMVNIGVAIGVVPTTGITLPFISYGGSSLLVMCGIGGILLNISRDSA